MIAHVNPVEIESSVRFVSCFGCQGQDRRNLPIRSETRSHFTVSQERVIEPGIPSVGVAKVLADTETGLLDICSHVERYVFRGVKFKARRGQHSIHDPLS